MEAAHQRGSLPAARKPFVLRDAAGPRPHRSGCAARPVRGSRRIGRGSGAMPSLPFGEHAPVARRCRLKVAPWRSTMMRPWQRAKAHSQAGRGGRPSPAGIVRATEAILASLGRGIVETGALVHSAIMHASTAGPSGHVGGPGATVTGAASGSIPSRRDRRPVHRVVRRRRAAGDRRGVAGLAGLARAPGLGGSPPASSPWAPRVALTGVTTASSGTRAAREPDRGPSQRRRRILVEEAGGVSGGA